MDRAGSPGAACDVKRRQALVAAITVHSSVRASTQRHQRRNVLSQRPDDCRALQINSSFLFRMFGPLLCRSA